MFDSRPATHRFVGLALILVTLALFWPATHFGFIELDDDTYVANNPAVQQGLTRQSVAGAFTTAHANYWMPLTWLSFMADSSLQGRSPAGYHRTNVLLHALNVGLLFLVLRRLTGQLWASAIAAALFGWHPLRVEAVAWITARKDVLSTLCWLLAMLAHVDWTQRRRARHYVLMCLWMALGLMSKPMVVTLPFVLLLLDFWPLKRFGWGGVGSVGVPKLLLEKLPLFLLAAAASSITLFTHQTAGAMRDGGGLSLVDRLAQSAVCYPIYLGHFFWPVQLAVRYPVLETGPLVHGLAAGLALLALALVFYRGRARQPWLLVGWLWFLGVFVPIIGLVKIGTADFADRFTYVPSIGLGLMLVWGAASLRERWRNWSPALVSVATLALVSCLVLTRYQLGFWTDGETLFRRALAVTHGNNIMAHNCLGRALERQHRLADAQAQYEAALRLAPGFNQARANLGNLLAVQGRYPEAVSHLEAALRGTANDAKLHSNLGSVLFESGQQEAGLRHLREAVRRNPHLADAHFNLAQALRDSDEPRAALEHFATAARINPRDAAAHYEAGLLCLADGQSDLARSHFRAAFDLQPGDARYRQAAQLIPPRAPRPPVSP